MADLSYTVQARIRTEGRASEGLLLVDDQQVRYSTPANMGGKGAGASPETLLVGAVTACYSATLAYFLHKRGLPGTQVDVEAAGMVTGFPLETKWAWVTVNPTFHGADPEREAEYREAAIMAREHCFVGQTVAAGGVAYEVGTVTVRKD